MPTETLIWLIPLPPLLAFFLILLFTRKNNAFSHTVGVAAAATSWLLGMLVFFAAVGIDHFGEHPFHSAIAWLPTGETFFNIGVMIDPLSAAVLFFVAWTVLMIFIYSIGYHNFGAPKGDHDKPGLPPHGAEDHGHHVPSVEPMYSRFFAFIALFAFGMYTLVVSDNLLTLFVGWEIMGLCSYLLIGFWYAKPSARDAAKKAFLTTRIGDVFMLLGIVALYSATGTLNFHEILRNENVLHMLATSPSGVLGLSAAGLIGLLLFIGTVGKSAQWPLHVWLPDAMEGPTPVSAMIHAATMVSAGVYMVLRMFPLLSAGWHHGDPLTTTMTVMAFIGAFTAIFAATIAVAQKDIKRVLAYSTISQLGFMIAALGIGAYVAAAFHLVTHAFFKALLFLGSGSVIHGMEHGVLHTGEHVDPQDMFNMGGLKKKMPITFWTFLIGGFALSGFPLITSGFWSKDEILADAFANHHYALLITLSLAALLTALYTMRQITLTFFGAPRTKAAEHASENKLVMTGPLMVLSVFAIIAGWVGIPEHFPVIGGLLPNWFHDFVGSSLLEHPHAPDFSWIPLGISLGVALGGLGLGYLVYRKAGAEDPLRKPLGPLYTLLENKYYFDELYTKVFIRPAGVIAEKFSYWFLDRKVIDGVLHWIAQNSINLGLVFRDRFEGPVISGVADWAANSTAAIGRVLRKVQTGAVQQYLLLVALVAFGGLFYYLFTVLR
ncbi:MAG: NADH-quinone oxidoreductase subunit L [Anaerolineales bacterium]|nr:NADH-quinone oxidoreductase subunit L [Anaerolineales bacterium]